MPVLAALAQSSLQKRARRLFVSGRREKEGNEVIAEIKKLDGEAIFIKTDVSKESDVKVMIDVLWRHSVGWISPSTMPVSSRCSLHCLIRPKRLPIRLWTSTSKVFGYR
jgi:NAD(P)-dependent dehydrogenase (short-subunit alcohol dehydrogenase family)